jgi:hypothetical protein
LLGLRIGCCSFARSGIVFSMSSQGCYSIIAALEATRELLRAGMIDEDCYKEALASNVTLLLDCDDTPKVKMEAVGMLYTKQFISETEKKLHGSNIFRRYGVQAVGNVPRLVRLLRRTLLLKYVTASSFDNAMSQCRNLVSLSGLQRKSAHLPHLPNRQIPAHWQKTTSGCSNPCC